MTVRHRFLEANWRAGLLVCALLFLPGALFAQDEPPPFWLPAAPAKEQPEQPAKKKKKPSPPPKKTPRASDDKSEPKPKPKPARKTTPVKTKKPARKKPARKSEEPIDETPVETPAPAPAKKKHHYEPLPPLPHIEPEQPPPLRKPYYQDTYQPPATNYPQQPVSPPEPAPRAAPPNYQPTIPSYPPPQQPFAPATPRPQPFAPAQPQPAPQQPYWDPRAPAPRPQVAVPIDEQRGAQPQEDDDADSRPALRRFSAELVFGLWGKANSDGQGRDWTLAYGVDFGLAIFRWLQVDLRGVRSSGTGGNAYVNATASHLLFDGRAEGVVTIGKFAGFVGGGGGLVLEQTQLGFQDVGGSPTSLSSSGLQPVGELFLGVRARPWRGLTLRLEFDGLLRQGNLEPILLAGAGWAF